MNEPVTASELATLRARIAATGPSGLSNSERIELICAAEDLKHALAGLQAVLTAEFDAATRVEQAAAGVPGRRRGAGVASQVGLARRESLRQAQRHVGLAAALAAEMPYTLAALRTGTISEWRATIMARETACLTVEHRRMIDAELCSDMSRLDGWGDRRLAEEARRIAYRLDPHSVVNRAAHAMNDRYVSIRPAPDTMAYLTALLPVIDAVTVHASLAAAAEVARCAGDIRSKGQAMADALVDRLTGGPVPEQATGGSAARRKLVVNLVMTDRALVGIPTSRRPWTAAGSCPPDGRVPRSAIMTRPGSAVST